MLQKSKNQKYKFCTWINLNKQDKYISPNSETIFFFSSFCVLFKTENWPAWTVKMSYSWLQLQWALYSFHYLLEFIAAFMANISCHLHQKIAYPLGQREFLLHMSTELSAPCYSAEICDWMIPSFTFQIFKNIYSLMSLLQNLVLIFVLVLISFKTKV